MPRYGALGATFMAVRGLQAVSLIAIIGMTANFISEMVTNNTSPPSVLVGTLSVTCIAVLYCAITFILFLDAILPFLINTGMDGLLLIAVIVVAVTVGKPLSFLNCPAISNSGGSTYDFTSSLAHNIVENGAVDYDVWIGATKTTCYEMKAIWGLTIALCILFAFSMTCSICLWRRVRAEAAAEAKAMETGP